MARYDLSETEWRLIEPLLPNKPRGVPRVDDRRVINGIFYVLLVVCVGILIGGEFIHKHPDFPIEAKFPGFYALFGFLAYCGIITGAVMLRTVLKRDEDYYDE